MMLSPKLRKWAHEGVTAWGWNGDVERPVFTPSVLSTGVERMTEQEYQTVIAGGKVERRPQRCHTFVGCNGAQPGEVIFLGDCTHALAGQVHEFLDLPAHMRDEITA